MADLTPAAARSTASEPARRVALLTAVAAVLGIVGLGLARVTAGWSPLAPDDARYLFVGLSVLDGEGPVTPNGGIYLLRSPVFGVVLALGSRLLGGDPIDGARLVAVGVAMSGMLGGLRVAWLVAGPTGAVGTAIALTSTPLVWQLLPSLRIDMAQAACIVLLLLVAWRPTRWRWAAAGAILGVAILVKETALPLLLLPAALVGTVSHRVVLGLAATYVAAALLTAGWWWVIVWMSSGQVFPLNAFAVVESRDVAGSLRLPWLAGAIIGIGLLGWSVVADRARRERGPRLLLFAAIGLAPAAIYAASNGLGARNFAALAVLSSIAIGVGSGTLAGIARDRGLFGHLERRRLTMAVVVASATVIMVTGQWSVARPGGDRLADALVGWIGAHLPDGGRIVMSFQEREVVALRRFGRTEVRSLPVRRVDVADDPASYLWMGLRDAQLFGYTQRNWETALTDPPPAYLIVVSPHPFTPVDLLHAGSGAATLPGLTPVATLEAGRDRADILRVDPAEVERGTAGVPLHLSADAALAWLDLAAGPDGDDDAVARLLAARPVVSGTAITTLVERLGTRACAIPGPAGAITLTPAPTCPA